MKKIFILLFALLVSVQANAERVSYMGLDWQLDPSLSKACVLGNTLTEPTDLVIPATITYEGAEYQVTSIDGNAFKNCDFLLSVVMPNSIEYLGSGAFYKCSNLNSVVLSEGLTEIPIWLFQECTSLKNIKIPENITKIGSGAFCACISISNLEIPESVTEIGNSAFMVCTGMQTISLPKGLTQIGYDTFENCSSLKEIELPESVTYIGDNTFYGCESLERIVIPDLVTEIGKRAFYGCEKLSFVNIPSEVTSIGNEAFMGCTNLVLVCYNAMDAISVEDVFSKTVYNNAMLCASANNIGDAAPWCNFNQLNRELNLTAQELKNVKHAVRHDNNLFLLKDNFVASLVANFDKYNSVCEIPVFVGKYDIDYYVTTIGEKAFSGCYMNTLSIPNSISEIGAQAFAGCSQLNIIECDSPGDIVADKSIFDDETYSAATLIVGKGNVEVAKSTTPWMYFDTIRDTPITGINDVLTDDLLTEDVDIFDLSGNKIINNTDFLSSGIYILHQDGKSRKIIVR